MGSYTSGYHAAMKDKIDRHLTEQPEYLALCYQYMKSLQAGAFDSDTVYHLNLERSLARWPYNSTSIYIFYCTEQWPDIDASFNRT